MKFLIKEISTSRKEVRIQIVPFKSIKTEYYQFGQSDGNFDEGTIDSQSVPFDLAKFTSITSDPIFRNLRQFVQEEVKDWPNKVNGLGIIRLENLPDKERVKSCWNHTFKTSGEKSVNIEDFKYSNLMYMLRNSLVHQFQGKGSEMGTGIPKNEPYYQLYKGFDESLKLTPNSIELVFPTPMLQTICKDALKNVCTYLREGNINPHPYYYSGDYWLNHLNG